MRLLRNYLLVAVALTGLLAIAYILIPTAPLPPGSAPRGYIDMHVHAACIGVGDSGCFLSPDIFESYKYSFYLRAFGVTEQELRSQGDPIVLERLNTQIGQSTLVDKAVVLALDGVITNGQLDRQLTQVYVPNAYLAGELGKYPNLLFGASINPYRPDALQRLETAKLAGAVLIKWIPGIMHIDPADTRLVPFYEKLKELQLPLLSHAGQERSFATSRDELGDPKRLSLPLERGVTVIAAHLASTGENEGEEDFLRLLPMFKQYPNLYADISSLTQINKLGYLNRTLEEPSIHERLVFGSDWPLQFFPLVSAWYQLGSVSAGKLKAIAQLESTWDRDVSLKRAMGVPDHVFERSRKLLHID